eukprot:m.934711 g.934711  ORF g.934711 m.934711 type:complete len:340 (-) comp23799_c0_seq16:191-1210(-)
MKVAPMPMASLNDARDVVEAVTQNLAESVRYGKPTQDTLDMLAPTLQCHVSDHPNETLDRAGLLQYIQKTWIDTMEFWLSDTAWAVPSGNRVISGQIASARQQETGREAQAEFSLLIEFNDTAQIVILNVVWDVQACGFSKQQERHKGTVPSMDFAKEWVRDFDRNGLVALTGQFGADPVKARAEVEAAIDKWLAPGAEVVIGDFASTDRTEVIDYMLNTWILGTKSFNWSPPINLYADSDRIHAYMGAWGLLGNDHFSNFVWAAEWVLTADRKISRIIHTYHVKTMAPDQLPAPNPAASAPDQSGTAAAPTTCTTTTTSSADGVTTTTTTTTTTAPAL